MLILFRHADNTYKVLSILRITGEGYVFKYTNGLQLSFTRETMDIYLKYDLLLYKGLL